MKTRDRLRIAVQKSGRLSEPSQNLLAQCGLSFRQSRDKLFCFGENQPVDLLLVRDDDRLYGRYWGAVAPVPFLHFETAYYQAIEAAIELRIPIIEGGAQGEHKMARGFLPHETVSCHWLAEPAFADAVERFLQREGGMIDGYLDELNDRSPLRRADRG